MRLGNYLKFLSLNILLSETGTVILFHWTVTNIKWDAVCTGLAV